MFTVRRANLYQRRHKRSHWNPDQTEKHCRDPDRTRVDREKTNSIRKAKAFIQLKKKKKTSQTMSFYDASSSMRWNRLPLNLERMLASSLFILLISASLLLPGNRREYFCTWLCNAVMTPSHTSVFPLLWPFQHLVVTDWCWACEDRRGISHSQNPVPAIYFMVLTISCVHWWTEYYL